MSQSEGALSVADRPNIILIITDQQRFETIRALATELTVPLIGFAGAPFTVASYLIEGAPSRTYARTKALMLGDPDLWFALLDRLVDLAVASLRSQVAAGARALQLFDSWAGILPPDEFDRWVIKPAAAIVKRLRARHGKVCSTWNPA